MIVVDVSKLKKGNSRLGVFFFMDEVVISFVVFEIVFVFFDDY